MLFEIKARLKDNQQMNGIIDAKDQSDALMKIMKFFSKDGIYCTMNISVIVKPLNFQNRVLPVSL